LPQKKLEKGGKFMAEGRSHSLEKLRTGAGAKRFVDKKALELFCAQVTDTSSLQHEEWDQSDPNEEIELLFGEIKTRKGLARTAEYTFDNELPRAIFQSFRVKPFHYSDIAGLWIIQESGIPVLSFNWRPNPDQILLAGFFGAMCSFAGSLGQDLREISLEGTRFLVTRESDLCLIFAMAIPFSLPAAQGLDLLSKVKEAFISRYQHLFSSGTEILYQHQSQYAEFSRYLTDLFFQTELRVYLQTGVLRTQNPLVFQLARSILPCTDDDLVVLRILEKKPTQVLGLRKIARRAQIPEARVKMSLRQLEQIDLVKSLQDGRSKKYASNLRGFLLSAAAEPDIHHLVDLAVKEFQQLIDHRLVRAKQRRQLLQSRNLLSL
jgi:predicted transcriptional regulator